METVMGRKKFVPLEHVTFLETLRKCIGDFEPERAAKRDAYGIDVVEFRAFFHRVAIEWMTDDRERGVLGGIGAGPYLAGRRHDGTAPRELLEEVLGCLSDTPVVHKVGLEGWQVAAYFAFTESGLAGAKVTFGPKYQYRGCSLGPLCPVWLEAPAALLRGMLSEPHPGPLLDWIHEHADPFGAALIDRLRGMALGGRG
jgi:hypothetical protein